MFFQVSPPLTNIREIIPELSLVNTNSKSSLIGPNYPPPQNHPNHFHPYPLTYSYMSIYDMICNKSDKDKSIAVCT